MSSDAEPVWVRQGLENQPITIPVNGRRNSNPRIQPGMPPTSGLSNGSPQFTNRKSPTTNNKISGSPLSSSQIRAGPFGPESSPAAAATAASSGSSASSSGSSHNSVSLSRSNSGSQPGTPTHKPSPQSLPNVSVISTTLPTGPASNLTANFAQVPLMPRPDMIPESRSSLQPLSPPVVSGGTPANAPPLSKHTAQHSNNQDSPSATNPPLGHRIAHPAFIMAMDDSHLYNGQESGGSALPDLVSNGNDCRLDNSGHSEEGQDIVDLNDSPKRRPFRHSYSDGIAPRRRSVTMAEAKTHAFTRLQEELTNAQTELKLKDEECEKLSKVRTQIEHELEDLTASLFEEANKQVQDANVKRLHTEKLLAEADQKIEVLQAEVVALKQLVLTSTPNSPNKHLHPQIDEVKKEKSLKPFWKTHRRSTSHHEFTKESRQVAEAQQQQTKIKCKEIDTACLEEFQSWRLKPEMNHSTPFFCRIFNEDIRPCLDFQNRKLATRLQECVENNCLTIEPIPGDNSYPRKCSLTETNKLCNYKIRLDDDQEWHSISQLCRNRIAAVCDFYTYIRYIQQGLVKSEDKEAFYEIARLRRQMALARLGFT